MTETRFLTAIESYLSGVFLTPLPALIGDVEPTLMRELPAIVLSLEETSRKKSGLGQRTIIVKNGNLAITRQIDLAHPVLEPGSDVSLVSEDRFQLTLPHCGLVRADGSVGQLSGADLVVTIDGVGQTVVADEPISGQLSADHTTGLLTFGEQLPDNGALEASYYIGSWEQTIVRLQGILRVDICARYINDLRQLTTLVRDGLLDNSAKTQIHRLLMMDISGLGAIVQDRIGQRYIRRRSIRLSFTFDDEINAPVSSGGIIQRIELVSQLNQTNVDKRTGAIQAQVVTETE